MSPEGRVANVRCISRNGLIQVVVEVSQLVDWNDPHSSFVCSMVLVASSDSVLGLERMPDL